MQVSTGEKSTTGVTHRCTTSSCSFTMWASCWKMEPNSTIVCSIFFIVSARLCM